MSAQWLVDTVDAHDRGFLYGDGLFETVAVRQGHVRWLEGHTQRLRRSGDALGFDPAWIERGCAALDSCRARPEGLWRMTLTRASTDDLAWGGSGCVRLRHRPLPPPRAHLKLGAMPSSYLPQDILGEHKTTSYARSVMVKRWAVAHGFDDALRVSACGMVSETSCANVFALIEDTWVTPPVHGLLPGVTRAGVLRLLKEGERPHDVRPLTLLELARARAIVITSAGIGARAVASVDGHALDASLARWLEREVEGQ